MKTNWEAWYFDGVTARRQSVIVTVTPQGLAVRKPDGSTGVWLYADARQTQGFHRGELLRLEMGLEALMFPDSSAVEVIAAVAPGVRFRTHGSADAKRWTRVAVFAALSLAVLVPALIFWGVPLLGEGLAAVVPVSFEERLGEAVVATLAPEEMTCHDSRVVQVTQKILATLQPALRDSPYQLRVRVSDDPAVNAFAAPAGYIVICRGLLEKCRSPEEFAGVLAHEIQHVVQRHSTKALCRQMALWVLIGLVLGDAQGTMTAIAGGITNLSYQRQDEEAADRDGMMLLQQAGIDPQGMVRLLRTLEKEAGSLPRAARYLSSHPLPKERVAALERLAAQARYSPIELVERGLWQQTTRSCRGRGALQ